MVFVEYIYFVLYANLDSGSLSILILYIFSPDRRSLPFFFFPKEIMFVQKGQIHFHQLLYLLAYRYSFS